MAKHFECKSNDRLSEESHRTRNKDGYESNFVGKAIVAG
jgi:hypothetical protein